MVRCQSKNNGLKSSSFIDNSIKIETKINIEDLVLPNKLFGIPIMEKNLVKNEPSNVDGKSVLENNNHSHFDNGQRKNDNFLMEMRNEIEKLFHEFHNMSLNEYFQSRVPMVQQLFEKYLKTYPLEKSEERMVDKSVPKKNKLFQCEFCSNSFKQKENLISHFWSVHEGKKPFKCLSCEQSFTVKRNLNRHTLTKHKKDSEYSKENFYGRKKQVKSNSGVDRTKLPFSCEICFSDLKQKENLSVHISAVHEGNRPFKCSACDGTFTVKRNLTRHLKKKRAC